VVALRVYAVEVVYIDSVAIPLVTFLVVVLISDIALLWVIKIDKFEFIRYELCCTLPSLLISFLKHLFYRLDVRVV
jgi:hypothetical protein